MNVIIKLYSAMEPLIKDTLNSRHHCLEDSFCIIIASERTTLYNGQNEYACYFKGSTVVSEVISRYSRGA